jgi:hypothetical protein
MAAHFKLKQSFTHVCNKYTPHIKITGVGVGLPGDKTDAIEDRQ